MASSNDRVEFAIILRGVAAICVLIAHYTGAFWLAPAAVAEFTHLPAATSEQVSIAGKMLWLHITLPNFNWGAFGVALFFLVSGFVIPFSLQKQSLSAFAVGRFFRIFPTYAVGFTICLLAIWLGGRAFGIGWPFNWPDLFWHYIPGLRDLAGAPSIDGVVWTLEIEVKFYVLCALGIRLFRKPSISVMVLPALVSLIGWLLIGHVNEVGQPDLQRWSLTAIFAAPYLIFMFIGTVFYLRHTVVITRWLAAVLITVLGLAQWGLTVGGPYAAGAPVLWSYVYALGAFTAAAALQRFLVRNPVTRFFADISYPLYAVHAIAGYVALRLLLEWGVNPWFTLATVGLGAVITAWLIHLVVERPSHELGRRLGQRFSPPLQSKLEPTPAE